jgi:hypothetical protein
MPPTSMSATVTSGTSAATMMKNWSTSLSMAEVRPPRVM